MASKKMATMKVKMDNMYIPTRAHKMDAGLDLFAPHDFDIPAHSTVTIDTGVHVAIEEGFYGAVKSRSSMLQRFVITDGTIDAGYTGPIKVVLMNLGEFPCEFFGGEKIAQLVIHPIVTPSVKVVDYLEETERGDNGFGSTGK